MRSEVLIRACRHLHSYHFRLHLVVGRSICCCPIPLIVNGQS